MSRELRKVPANWQHPKDENGNYKPIHNEYYGDAVAEWIKNHNEWLAGTHEDLLKNPELKKEYPFYSMWSDNPPDVDYYLHEKWTEEQLTHIQLYETCSEGTPQTPPFPKDDLMELCKYAEKHATTFGYNKTTAENWYKMLSDGMVIHREGNVVFI